MPAWTSATLALKGAWAAAIGAVMLALVIFASVQTARLNGFHVGPIGMRGWIRTAELRAEERDAEIRAHRATKETYRAAQAIAAQLETDRLTKIQAQQEAIRNATARDYQSRLDSVRARADQLRREAAARAGSAGPGGTVAVPAPCAAGGGAAAEAADQGFPRSFEEQLARDLIASEQAEQLDALIDFVIAQNAINPNAD